MLSGEPAHGQYRKRLEFGRRHPGGEDQADPSAAEAAAGERQCLHRGAVEPLLVVHNAEHGPFRRQHLQQGQRGERDDKTVRRLTRVQAESDA